MKQDQHADPKENKVRVWTSYNVNRAINFLQKYYTLDMSYAEYEANN